ncbi:hypothetical protein MM326_09750 [Alkalihalobacillus sp. LMS6]|uniref:tubby C-terminal domain-like protein n=1 Tax=Alkalihalobacillus sp. LMS6 TaxID=2924034 RepID=UPI0020D1C66F|nr:hypothetical protein [Alkalihalobacillus sp. LMS6]UTR08273.1 hypothetical protein MM326_09750 [Alkalihalobacillus sp. LMS6]
MEDFDYYYEMLVNVNSKTEQVVFNDRLEKMYTLKRFNDNIIDKILAYREPKSCVNILLRDEVGNSQVTVTESWSFKRKFKIKSQAAAKPISAKANPQRFEVRLGRETYSIVKSDDSIRIVYKDNQKVLESRIKRKGLSLNHYIKIYNQEIDTKLAIACLHTFIIAY